MAKRREKLTLIRLILILGIAVWLPALFRMLAGVPGSDPADPPRANTNAPVIDAQPVSHRQPTDPAGDRPEVLAPAPADLRLSATHLSGGRKTAVINGQFLQEGDSFRSTSGEYFVRGIEDARVRLVSGNRQYELTIVNHDDWGSWTPFTTDDEP